MSAAEPSQDRREKYLRDVGVCTIRLSIRLWETLDAF